MRRKASEVLEVLGYPIKRDGRYVTFLLTDRKDGILENRKVTVSDEPVMVVGRHGYMQKGSTIGCTIGMSWHLTQEEKASEILHNLLVGVLLRILADGLSANGYVKWNSESIGDMYYIYVGVKTVRR